MSNNYNCDLTIEGDRLILEEIAKKYHDNSGKIIDSSDLEFDCSRFDDLYLRLHYESSNEEEDAIAILSTKYPSLTFKVNYDSYPDNLSGVMTIVNGRTVSRKEIPREITLTIPLIDIADCDCDPQVEYDGISQAIAREIETLIRDNTWGKVPDSILNLIQEIQSDAGAVLGSPQVERPASRSDDN